MAMLTADVDVSMPKSQSHMCWSHTPFALY